MKIFYQTKVLSISNISVKTFGMDFNFGIFLVKKSFLVILHITYLTDNQYTTPEKERDEERKIKAKIKNLFP